MLVHGKDGQEFTLISSQPVVLDGRTYLVVALKHPKFVEGVLVNHLLVSPGQFVDAPRDGEMVEVVIPENNTIEKDTNNDSNSPHNGEVPSAND